MNKVFTVLFIIWLLIPNLVHAFPIKPITIYVPFTEGGTSEKLVRIVSDQVSEENNIKIIINTNTAGVSATDYINSLKNLPNDGHHIIFGNVGTHASNIALNEKAVLYDPVADFMPIVFLGKTPLYMVVRPNFPANNFKEFIQYIQNKTSPRITLAHSGYGSTAYLAGVYLSSILKIDPILIPYSGSSLALKDVANDYVDVFINQTTSVLPFIKGELVKPIFVTTFYRSSIAPQVPTTQEIGLVEFDIQGWNMLFAPKGTDIKRVLFLNQLFKKALDNKFVKGQFRLTNTLMISSEKNSFNSLREFVQSQIGYWRDIISVLEKKPQ